VELAGINSLFLDTAPVIYFIEAHPQYGPLMKDIVDSFKSGALEAYTSVFTITEVLPKPVSQNKTHLVETFMRFLKNEVNLNLLNISPEIAESAGHLRAKYNSLRTMDAIQLSAAIKAEVDIFVTNDIKLKQVTEVRVIVLNDYVSD
jgi:predicted nucleic acid-binding protein